MKNGHYLGHKHHHLSSSTETSQPERLPPQGCTLPPSHLHWQDRHRGVHHPDWHGHTLGHVLVQMSIIPPQGSSGEAQAVSQLHRVKHHRAGFGASWAQPLVYCFRYVSLLLKKLNPRLPAQALHRRQPKSSPTHLGFHQPSHDHVKQLGGVHWMLPAKPHMLQHVRGLMGLPEESADQPEICGHTEAPPSLKVRLSVMGTGNKGPGTGAQGPSTPRQEAAANTQLDRCSDKHRDICKAGNTNFKPSQRCRQVVVSTPVLICWRTDFPPLSFLPFTNW